MMNYNPISDALVEVLKSDKSKLELVPFTDFKKAWDGDDTAPYSPLVHAIRDGGVFAIRMLSGMSQTDFSDVYGVSKRSLQCWETTGRESRDIRTQSLIMMAYCVYTDVVGGAELPKSFRKKRPARLEKNT